ncbi:MAG: hypothetical protein JOS17DRAFT_750334 [Linnemannia elongata]|nr:MAG: hypothetical protein JOS17DRAFT_750334 [Linnemannia elongata]
MNGEHLHSSFLAVGLWFITKWKWTLSYQDETRKPTEKGACLFVLLVFCCCCCCLLFCCLSPIKD